MKRVLFLFFLIISLFSLFYQQKHPFTPTWLYGQLEVEPIDLCDEQMFSDFIRSAEKPLHYLGKGGQMIVFATEDDQYVCKFIKFKLLQEIRWNHFSLRHGFKKAFSERKQKLLDLVEGYKDSFLENRENTALVAVCFFNGPKRPQALSCIDQSGALHRIDLKDAYIVVQKKGDLFVDLLKEANNRADYPAIQEMIRGVLSLYDSSYEKGFYDRDLGASHNVALVEGKFAHIDLGKMTKNPFCKDSFFQRKDLERTLKRLQKDLQTIGIFEESLFSSCLQSIDVATLSKNDTEF